MPKSVPITIENDFPRPNFLKGRTPDTTNEEAKEAFVLSSDYRDCVIQIGQFRGAVDGRGILKGKNWFRI